MGICHIGHGALGLQELALVLQRGAQDGVQADISVLQEDRGAVSHFPACTLQESIRECTHMLPIPSPQNLSAVPMTYQQCGKNYSGK